jgi:Tfp pilus assembly protein PilX
VNGLRIDFVRRDRGSPWPGRLLLALALAFSLDVAISYQDARSALRMNEARIATAQARSGAPAVAVSAEEVAAVRETVERLAMPWDKLFGALEATASDQVALLGIEPDSKAGTVVISGDSKDYLAALTYVLNLSRAESLSRVQLLRHEAKSNDPQAAVSFAVSAAWSKGK